VHSLPFLMQVILMGQALWAAAASHAALLYQE